MTDQPIRRYIETWTGAWWQQRLRYRRWPHFKWSSGWHRWKRGDVVDRGYGLRRQWLCTRCGGSLLTWPLDTERPLLRKGEEVVSDD